MVEKEIQYVDVYRDVCSESGNGNGGLHALDDDVFGIYGLKRHPVSVYVGLL